jgi:hypothetical protein
MCISPIDAVEEIPDGGHQEDQGMQAGQHEED